nr:Chain A, Peptide 38138 [Plasmodium falciparum]
NVHTFRGDNVHNSSSSL